MKNLAIVCAKQYNRHTNVLFMMDIDTDERYNNGNYQHVDHIVKRTPNLVTTEDGTTYQLFSDWSVKKVN